MRGLRRSAARGRRRRWAALRPVIAPLSLRYDLGSVPPRPRVDDAMVKALARAFRWRKQLDTGVHATIEDLAKSKGIGKAYISQVLRLTLLAPENVEAILDGRQSAELQLNNLLHGCPPEWEGQVAPSNFTVDAPGEAT